MYEEEFKRIHDGQEISLRDFIDAHGLEDAKDRLMDNWVQWHNRNSVGSMERILGDEDAVLLCRAKYFVNVMMGVQNNAEKCFTEGEFRQALDREITLWRGGTGTYDPTWTPMGRDWVSYTAKRSRARAFSNYHGTRVGDFLDANHGEKWVVELRIPLRNVLAYCDVGDAEAIVSLEDSMSARVLSTEGQLA